jgi:cellulose synthase/poly-beta-1,6-N-acetylglucosamine synthase-like glycosyltransferase
MRLSVIIPCLNEEKHIGETIKRLEESEFPRDEFEIVVSIDAATADMTREAALEAGADKVVSNEKKGTNNTRQGGVDAAEGEILAFLDADCRPPKDWLKRIWEAFEADEKKELGILSGPYEYYDLWPVTKFLADAWQRVVIWLIAAADLIFRKKWAVALGGNMAIRKTALESIGGLDARFTFFGDDSDTALRIRRAGYKARFDRKLKVESSARRFKKKGLVRTAALYTVAYVKLYFGKNKPLGVDVNHKIEKIERLKKAAFKGHN